MLDTSDIFASDPLEALRTWLSNREAPNDCVDHYQADCVIHLTSLDHTSLQDAGRDPDDSLASQHDHHDLQPDHQHQLNARLATWPDLHLRYHSKSTTPTHKYHQTRFARVELEELFDWLLQFLHKLRQHQQTLETLVQLCSPLANRPELAKFHVRETISLVASSLTLDIGLDVCLNQLTWAPIDGRQHSLHDCVRMVLLRLYAHSSVQLIANKCQARTCLMLAYLVDLMHECGAPKDQVQLFVEDTAQASCDSQRLSSSLFLDSFQAPSSRPSVIQEHYQMGKISTPSEHRQQANSLASELGTPTSHCQLDRDDADAQLSSPTQTKRQQIYICLGDCDVYQAPIVILESYLREPTCPNGIVLIDEAIYQLFIENWQRNFSRVVRASSDLKLLEISVDLNSIDVNVAKRTAGYCINMIKFRSISELCKLMLPLRKISHIQLWTSNYLLAHELCLSGRYLRRCREFWLNHLPTNLSGRRFYQQLMDHCQETLRNELMDESYSDLYYEHEQIIDKLRKQQVAFQRKYTAQKRNQLVMMAYLQLINKCKSLKQIGVTIGESMQRMKRFHLNAINNLQELEDNSRIETTCRPVGLAILALDSKGCVKSKAIVMEFVFKNLLIGNAALVICPQNLLGLRFPHQLMAKLPFQLVETKPSIEATFIEHTLQSSTPNCSLLVGQHPADLLHQSMNVTTNLSQQDKQQMFYQSSCLSWTCSADSGVQASPPAGTADSKRLVRCPKSVYVINLMSQQQSTEMTSEIAETLVMCLGCKRTSLWSPDGPLHCARFITNESLDQDTTVGSPSWTSG